MNRKRKEAVRRFFSDWRNYVVFIYVLVMLFFLLAELGVPQVIHQYRATDQVILLVTLLFLPFFFLLAPSILDTLKFRLPSGQEFDIKIKEIDSRVQEKYTKLTITNQELVSRLGMAEQALLPIISGHNPERTKRLEQGHLIIGSKEFQEQQIISSILVGRIHQAQLSNLKHVQRRIPNGSSYKNFADLRYGWIDGYVEYTGTGMMLMMLLDHFFDLEIARNENKGDLVRKIVAELDEISRNRYGIAWLKPIGLHNEYVIVLDRAISEAHEVYNISDLVKIQDKIDFCFTSEFLHRRDGLERLREKYGLHFRHEFDVGIDDRYRTMEEGKAQATSGFATDPEIDYSAFVPLKDDDLVFPDYHAVPIFRVEALEKISGLENAVNELADSIDNKSMIRMIKDYNTGKSRSVSRGIAEEFLDKRLRKTNEAV